MLWTRANSVLFLLRSQWRKAFGKVGAEEVRDRHLQWVVAAHLQVHNAELSKEGFEKISITEPVVPAD